MWLYYDATMVLTDDVGILLRIILILSCVLDVNANIVVDIDNSGTICIYFSFAWIKSKCLTDLRQ